MLKSRIFGNTRLNRISMYVRHGPKTNNTSEAVLTRAGREKIIRRTKILPQDELITICMSPTKRTVQTAQIVAKKRKAKTKLAEELNSETLILDQQRFLDYFKDGKKWANFLRDWLNGKLDDFIISPNIVVKRVLKSNEINWKSMSGVFVQITHSMILEALIEKLTGRKFETLLTLRKEFNQKEIDTAEGFMLYFAKGRVKMEFRKQHFDVTKRFKQLLV